MTNLPIIRAINRTARIFALIALVLSGCVGDVLHENPLDPQSASYEPVGSVFISVSRFYAPFDALPGAKARFSKIEDGANKNLVRLETTNASGELLVNGLVQGQYEIEVTKDGFSTARDTITVEVAKQSVTSFQLDGLPVVSEESVATVHISRWFPQPQDLFALEIDVLMDDPDGITDIDSVWLDIPSIGVTHALLATPELGRFVNTLPEDRLGSFTLQQLLGLDVFVRAVDHAGFQNAVQPVQLVRVIEKTPIAVSPQGEALLADSEPVLVWEIVRLPYSHTYRVDIVREETNIQIPVETIDNIQALETSVQVSAPLTSGDYFWTISIVDTFGNRSRSKEAGFRIQ